MDTQNESSKSFLNAAVIALISLGLGLFFDYFFWMKSLGLGFIVYMSLIIASLYGMAAYSKIKISKQVYWLCLPLLFFSAMIFVRASTFLTFWNVSACILLVFMIFAVSFGHKIKHFTVWNYY